MKNFLVGGVVPTTGKRGREIYFVASIFLLFLVPFAIPGMGASLTFTFTVLLTLLAWLVLKWEPLRALSPRRGFVNQLTGTALIVGDFAENIVRGSGFGLVDQLVVFVGLTFIFYGLGRFRFFVLPSAYILILIMGYWAENNFTQLGGLETWQAGLMASLLNGIGINASVSNNVVTILGASLPLSLEIAGPCTGIKGLLAFGTLSSMAVLDLKVSRMRLLLILGLGFAGAFLVNLARLGAIFIVAAYFGLDPALSVHTYLGYSMFIVWVLIYWYFAFRYLLPGFSRPNAISIVGPSDLEPHQPI